MIPRALSQLLRPRLVRHKRFEVRRRPADQGNTAEPVTIMAYGDGGVWGWDPRTGGRMAPRERWPKILEHVLNDNGRTRRFRVVEEGLNGRTTVLDDPFGPSYGSYCCNGRTYLMPCLHSHKPVDLVLLHLGINDLKVHFNVSPHQIAQANATLINDILTSYAGPGLDDMDSPPKVLLLAPPPILETRESLPWGFQGAEERSKKLPALLSKVAELAGPRVSFFDLGSVAAMSSDGVHLDQDAQRPVAEALAEKCYEVLMHR
jgi:lysophospholipase L1-like esterase